MFFVPSKLNEADIKALPIELYERHSKVLRT